MSKEAKQLLVMIVLIGGVLGALWLSVIYFSSDIQVRNKCYQKGVDTLPPGVDQTLLQTQSEGYKDCIQKN